MNKINMSEIVYGKNVIIFPGTVIGRPPMAPAGRTEIDYSRLELKPVIIGDSTIIGANTVIYNNVEIGNNCLIGDGVHIREGVSIGDGCIIGIGTKVGARATIGNNTRIMDLTNVASDAIIGNNVFIGPGVMMGNDNSMGRIKVKDGFSFTGPTIKDWVTVGMNACILPNIVIGEDALVGAGAVVSKNVSPAVLVMGVPAKEIRRLEGDELRCRK